MKLAEIKLDKPAIIATCQQDPQWYLALQPHLNQYFYQYTGAEKHPETLHKQREQFVLIIADLLTKNQLALGESGTDWDAERRPITKLIVHHSSRPPQTPLAVIEALGLLRLYAKQYSKKGTEEYGQPLWSNHFWLGRQTFMAYHYAITSQGEIKQLLPETATAWHAGNWEVNCESLAICFLDDLKNKTPTPAAIKAARELCQKYPDYEILGHCQINPHTTCPGSEFLTGSAWGSELTR